MKYDVAVIGGGPAGLTASIFTRRAGLSTICFEKLVIGGQASLSHNIENYPGFESVSGFDLTQKFFKQAKQLGTEFVFKQVEKIKQLKTGFSIKTKTGIVQAKKIIIANGTISRKLGLNEEKFVGKGISYCASCDGHFFKNKEVAIVGGGDSAFVYAEYLSRVASKVYILNRSEKLKASHIRIEKIKQLKNVKVLTNAKVTQLNGEDVLESIKINHNEKTKTLNVDGLFVAIGHLPDLQFLDFKVQLDKNGYIVVDKYMQTSVKNVYACGDITSKHFKQVVTACSDGAIAANSCVEE